MGVRRHHLRFLFYLRGEQDLPYRRTRLQTFGHCSLWINNLVFDKDQTICTNWYDAEEYLTAYPPFISAEFEVEEDIEVLTQGLTSGLQFSLKDSAREIKDRILEPQAVNCVWGGRTVLRNLGVTSYARTPDELFGEVLHLTESVCTSEDAHPRIRRGCTVLWPEGFHPDSVFAR